MIDHYDWAGGREAMIRFGPSAGRDGGPVVVAAAALFEEANRTRTFLIGMLRRLADMGWRTALPDLPGQGESPVATVAARLDDWREAFAAAVRAAGDRTYIFAMRGGCLVEPVAVARGRFHFDPVDGADLIRDLFRARKIASLGTGTPLVADDPRQPGPPLMLGGNLIDRALITALLDARPAPVERTVMLFPAPTSAHPKLKASHPVALWRAAEPRDDPALADQLAGDLRDWLVACGA